MLAAWRRRLQQIRSDWAVFLGVIICFTWKTGDQEVHPEEAGQAQHRQGQRAWVFIAPQYASYSYVSLTEVIMCHAWHYLLGSIGMTTWSHLPPLTSLLQTFIKTVNYNHIMPTRYTLDVDFKTSVSNDVLENSTKKVEVQKVRRRVTKAV